MLKPLVVREEGVSVWLYNVSRWQVKGTAPVSTRGHTRAQAHEGIKGKVAVYTDQRDDSKAELQR